jgi:hypothetical protein
MAIKMTMALHFDPYHGRASGSRVNECCFHRKIGKEKTQETAGAGDSGVV